MGSMPSGSASPLRSCEELLAARPGILFSLLDSAREPGIPDLLKESSLRHESLYVGDVGQELEDVAPYLVELRRDSALLTQLAHRAWGLSWGLFLTSDAGFEDVHRHLRRFLKVETEDGRQLYFRFYDPRALRIFLPTCTPDQLTEFFGPIREFVMEAESPAQALVFSRDGFALIRKEVELSTNVVGRSPSARAHER
jgi:hypothetical protein